MGIFDKSKIKNIETVADILEREVFQFATVDSEGNPHVRPLGACSYIDNKICICTNSTKEMSKQIKNNPNIEISCLLGEGPEWVRITAKAFLFDEESAKEKMLESSPLLQDMYEERKDIFEVFYLEEPKILYYMENGEIKEIK